MSAGNKFLLGLFDDDHKLLEAIKTIKGKGVRIHDVYTPFPVHGMDDAMGFHRTHLTVAGFIYGAMGTLTAQLFMSWIFVANWPINFGGKPHYSSLAFIPITFELTVLFCAVGMVLTFLIASNLGPGANNKIMDERQTDDMFVMAFDISGGGETKEIEKLLKDTGAVEVKEKEFDK
jgi:hypothetical protein